MKTDPMLPVIEPGMRLEWRVRVSSNEEHPARRSHSTVLCRSTGEEVCTIQVADRTELLRAVAKATQP